MSKISDEQIGVLAEQADRLADEKLCSRGEYHPDWHERRDEIFARAIEAAVLEAQGKHGVSCTESTRTDRRINE